MVQSGMPNAYLCDRHRSKAERTLLAARLNACFLACDSRGTHQSVAQAFFNSLPEIVDALHELIIEG
ncbi:hypothetical protein PINS_up010849 [Pythium insidiosum]|nr:hypothetical protein PINS_up010849 [Pythium insidiosum]